LVKRWDPFRELSLITEMMSRFLSEELSEQSSGRELKADWIPAVDLLELEDRYILKADLAGIESKKIKVEVLDQKLVLSGERPVKRGQAGYKFHRLERPYGKFYRIFPLPKEVDSEQVQARLREGVLEVILPKTKTELPKKIPIQTSEKENPQ